LIAASLVLSTVIGVNYQEASQIAPHLPTKKPACSSEKSKQIESNCTDPVDKEKPTNESEIITERRIPTTEQKIISHDKIQEISLIDSDRQETEKINDIFFVADKPHDQPPTNRDFSQYGTPIFLNENNLKNLEEQQKLSIPIGPPHTLIVEKTSKRNRSVKIKFSLLGETSIYRGFINVGQKATFGRITTPEASYELEVVNGKGWIVDTREIDPKTPKIGEDYLIPNT